MADLLKFTINDICDILGVQLPSEFEYAANERITRITQRLDYLIPGGCFLLLQATDQNREARLANILKYKPRFIVLEKTDQELPLLEDVPHVFVDSTTGIVQKIGNAVREALGVKIVGVTGSVGKTTTKEIIYSVLKQQYAAGRSPGNRNGTGGIFRNLQEIAEGTEIYVQEVGASLGDLGAKARTCTPVASVITNIGDAHLEEFGSREGVLQEKLKIVSAMPENAPAFLNYDDPLLRSAKTPNHPVISYAVENKNADYYAENIEQADGYMTFDVVHGERRTPVVLHAYGVHNVGNAVVALAVGEWAGMPLDKIVDGIAEFRTTGIRQTVHSFGGHKLYIDCYNSSPVALEGAIKTLEKIPVEPGGKHIAVVGGILELGEQSERLHIEIGEKIGCSDIDLVLAFGGMHIKRMAEAIRKHNKAVLYTNKRAQLNYWVEHLITKKDVALFKGSHGMKLFKTIDQVYGTAFHLDEDTERITEGQWRARIDIEKEPEQCTAGLSRYLGKEKTLKLPETIRGCKVFAVETACFRDNVGIQEVTIPAPVVNISKQAFSGCTSLEKVTLPKTLKRIDEEAFASCFELKEIVIPEGVLEICDRVFADCTALERVVLPASLGQIGEDVFAGCKKVEILYPETALQRKQKETDAANAGKEEETKRADYLKKELNALWSKEVQEASAAAQLREELAVFRAQQENQMIQLKDELNDWKAKAAEQ